MELSKIAKVDTSGRKTLTDEVMEKNGYYVKTRYIFPNGMTMAIIEKKPTTGNGNQEQCVSSGLRRHSDVPSGDNMKERDDED